ncbi:MAG: hypothetical protein ACHQK9_15175 [Reyranellales bacterium]
MHRLIWLTALSMVGALAMAAAPGRALANNCADLRNNIMSMDAQSDALPGYLSMRVQLASVYNRLCGSSPAQRTEYWYTIDGKQIGPVGAGDRPANAAYAATEEIGAKCAGTTNPSMCALALGAFANCKAPSPDIKEACSVLGGYGDPGDTVAATGGDPLPDAKLTIGGKTYDVPNACANALAQAADGARTTQVIRTCPDDLLAALGHAEGKDASADPTAFLSALGPLLQRGFNPPGTPPKGGFDAAFCAQMQRNADVCKQRENNMGPVGQQATGTTGQTGAFDDCSRLYSRFAGMCRMNVNQRPQIAAASAPKGASPPAAKPTAPQPQQQATAQPPTPAPPLCPGGMKPTKDGYCIGAGQNYCSGGMVCGDGMECYPGGRCFWASHCFPNEKHAGQGYCIPISDTECGEGNSCPPGTYCVSPGVCHGDPAAFSGPDCGSGRPSATGDVCGPNGTNYNPRQLKVCGTTLCNVMAECGPNNTCVSPYRQTKAVHQGSVSR